MAAYLCGISCVPVWWGQGLPRGRRARTWKPQRRGHQHLRGAGSQGLVYPVLLLDVLKGFLPVRVLDLERAGAAFRRLDGVPPDAGPVAVGHLYPVFARFRGGKGIATRWCGAGHPSRCGRRLPGGRGGSSTRYVSLGSDRGHLLSPAVALIFRESSHVLLGFSIGMCLLVFYTPPGRTSVACCVGRRSRMRLAGRDDRS